MLFLWALDHSLRPQAASTGRVRQAEAIFFVAFKQLTAPAWRAGGEGVAVNAFPVRDVIGVHPD